MKELLATPARTPRLAATLLFCALAALPTHAARPAHGARRQRTSSGGTASSSAGRRASKSTRGGPPSSGPLPIVPGDMWAYYKGDATPDSAWTHAGTVEPGWELAPSGTRGARAEAAARKPVFLRRTFELSDLSALGGVRLTLESADGFVAYVNGREAAKSGGGATGALSPGDTFIIPKKLLAAGSNVIAIQGFDSTVDGKSVPLAPALEAVQASDAVITVLSPASDAVDVGWNPDLCVSVSGPGLDLSAATLSFHGRAASAAAADDDLAIASTKLTNNQACVTWTGRQPASAYTWQASLFENGRLAESPESTFTTDAICTSNADCDDQNQCTTDTCDPLGSCNHTPYSDGSLTTCGLGVCQVTVETCRDGVLQPCVPGPQWAPDDTSCNTHDDDCNGLVDDGYVPYASSCGTGACHRTGMVTCQNGHEIDSCVPGQPIASNDITCDGIDDDCNGAVDDGAASTDITCGIGICMAYGHRVCEFGQWVDHCTPRPPVLQSDTNCNNVDSDCNGLIDDAYVPTPTVCGTGACRRTGMLTCQVGHEIDSCVPGAPLAPVDTTCDGIDDDCDGIVDDDIPVLPTECGVGFCHNTGQRTCENGHFVDSCVPLPQASPTDFTCNGVDDDCNGLVDDGYVPYPSTCGTGACARTGMVTCQNGHEVDSCVPGQPVASNDITCDGIDDDCNGAVDDGAASTDITCGIGICMADGHRVCENGQWVDHCTPRPPVLQSDTNCNNVDSDCNGLIDDAYVPTPTVCGTGACRRTGMLTCQVGHEIDSCVPGAPLAPLDTTCDGIDDDCDGIVDDDIPVVPTSCGVGFCANTGQRTCENGHFVDSCVPLPQAAPNDITCNGVDDDCNGLVDDGYVPYPSTCGTGACRRIGTVRCINGHEVDDCTPGAPVPEICNGLDDDCDGIPDNGGSALCSDGDSCNGIETCYDGCSPGTPAVVQSSISIPDDVTGISGGSVSVPVQIEGIDGSRIELTIGYDSSMLSATSVTKTAITSAANMTSNLGTPGVVHIVLQSDVPFQGAGPVAILGFQIASSVSGTTALNLTQADVNAGSVSTCNDSGRVEICSSLPPDVGPIALSGKSVTTIQWSPGAPGVVYDVAGGLLSAIRAERSPIHAACLDDDANASSVTDARAVPAGDGFYYVVRTRVMCGVGSYGTESSGEVRTPVSSCP